MSPNSASETRLRYAETFRTTMVYGLVRETKVLRDGVRISTRMEIYE
jgi:hypothetical protein